MRLSVGRLGTADDRQGGRRAEKAVDLRSRIVCQRTRVQFRKPETIAVRLTGRRFALLY